MIVDAKDPDVPAEYWVDFFEEIAQEAERGLIVALGDKLYFPRDPAWLFEVTTAGRLSRFYPSSIPRAAGQTLNDGSAVLTCRHPDDVTVPEVSSVAWTVPSGLTKDSQRESGSRAYVTLSGGTDGVDYEVVCRMTPTAGNVIEQTITVPVRAQ